MNERCEPPEGLRDMHLSHYIELPPSLPLGAPDAVVRHWCPLFDAGHWNGPGGDMDPKTAVAEGWRYLGPVPSHAEFTALLRAARKTREQLSDLSDVLNHDDLQVLGWHLNGAPERASKFFDDNDHGALEEIAAALRPFEGDDHVG